MSYVEGYYIQNKALFKEGKNEKICDQAHKATSVAYKLIWDHEKAVQGAAQTRGEVYLLNPLNHPFFWFDMYMLSRPIHVSSSSSSAGICGGSARSGGGKDECAVVFMILAIIALVAAVIGAIGLTIYQGVDAADARQTILTMKRLQQEALAIEIKETYAKTLPILEEQYIDKCLKTTFTAVVAVGLCLLTAAAAIALYALLNQVSIFHSAQILAITGGSIAGAGLSAYCIRPLVLSCTEEKRLQKYHELFKAALKLNVYMVQPAEILTEASDEKCFMFFQSMIFIKDGNQLSKAHYTKLKEKQLLEAGYIKKKVKKKVNSNSK